MNCICSYLNIVYLFFKKLMLEIKKIIMFIKLIGIWFVVDKCGWFYDFMGN